MRMLSSCLAGFILALPAASAAERNAKIAATPRDAIAFTAATARAFDRSGRHVTARTLPDGSVSIEQNGSFQNVTVARIGPGGTIETYCTTDETQARSWMAREDGAAANVEVAGPANGDPR